MCYSRENLTNHKCAHFVYIEWSDEWNDWNANTKLISSLPWSPLVPMSIIERELENIVELSNYNHWSEKRMCEEPTFVRMHMVTQALRTRKGIFFSLFFFLVGLKGVAFV